MKRYISSVQRPKADPEIPDFISWCSINKESLFETLKSIVSRTPTLMKEKDYRFDFGSYYCHHLAKDFNDVLEDVSVSENGFDMYFNKEFRISIKFQEEIFERDKKGNQFGEVTEPKPIVLKNLLGGSNKKIEGFDFLLAVERKVIYDKDGDLFFQSRKRYPTCHGKIGFAVASIEKVSKCEVSNSNNDQIKVKISKSEWDYQFTSRRFEDYIDEDEQNRVYRKCKEEMYDKIRGI